MIEFTIPLNPVTKKNHGQIVTIKGRPIMLPSKPYLEYEKKCKPYIPIMDMPPIDYPVKLECHFYMETRRKCDLTNLLQAVCDILVKYKLLADDNYSIVASVDGSKVEYCKENPRTEVKITMI